MKHQNPEQLREAAAIVAASSIKPMTRRQRLDRWADLLSAHGGPLEALRQIEYLPDAERRAYRGANTPLNVAYRDPVLRGDGLAGDTLGDAMDYFEMNADDAHHLLCDCHYMGSLTGHRLAGRLRRYADGNSVVAWARNVFAGQPG
jgi:hypothetical protein